MGGRLKADARTGWGTYPICGGTWPMACSCKDAGPCKRLWVAGVGKWDAEGEVSKLGQQPTCTSLFLARTMYLAPCGFPLAPSGRTPSLPDVVEMPSTSKAIGYSAPVPARRRKTRLANGFWVAHHPPVADAMFNKPRDGRHRSPRPSVPSFPGALS